MEARSYLENIANRTTMRAVIATMTKLLLVATLVGGVLLIIVSGGHPAALIIGAVLLVGSLVLARDVVVVTREARQNPLDLAFEPAPDRGLVTPGTVFGLALALALFGGVLAAVTGFGDGTVSAFAWGLLGVGAALALMGIPTLGVQDRKWKVLSDALAAHPNLVGYLQDARARFPKDAPFPFQASTDEVSIP